MKTIFTAAILAVAALGMTSCTTTSCCGKCSHKHEAKKECCGKCGGKDAKKCGSDCKKECCAKK